MGLRYLSVCSGIEAASVAWEPPAWAVRRLTPLECERLMGLPDGWTDIPWRGGRASDAPRYRALGNSMAVNCMRWIGWRIDQVEAIP
jgi:DNA (cytosine-5)-methyltransferase 1